MSDVAGPQATDTCPYCPTRLECACPDGAERCPDNGDCPCDKTVCPCGKHARRPPEDPPPSDPAPPPHTPPTDEPEPETPPWRRPGVIGLLAVLLLAIAIVVVLLGGGGGDAPEEIAVDDPAEEVVDTEPSADPDGDDQAEDTDAEEAAGESEAADEPDEPAAADEPSVEYEELAPTFDGNPVLADLGIPSNPFTERDCGRHPGVVHQTGGSPLEGLPEFGVVCSGFVDVPDGAPIPADRYLLVLAEHGQFQPPPGTMAPLQIGIGLDLEEGGPPPATEGEGLVRIAGLDVLLFGGDQPEWQSMDALNNGDFTPASMAGFSSRGPATIGIALKPEVTAPGIAVQSFGRATPDGQDPSADDPAASRTFILGPVCDGCTLPEPGRFDVSLTNPDGTTVAGVEVEPGLFVFPEGDGSTRVVVGDGCAVLESYVVNVGGPFGTGVEVVVTDLTTDAFQALDTGFSGSAVASSTPPTPGRCP